MKKAHRIKVAAMTAETGRLEVLGNKKIRGFLSSLDRDLVSGYQHGFDVSGILRSSMSRYEDIMRELLTTAHLTGAMRTVINWEKATKRKLAEPMAFAKGDDDDDVPETWSNYKAASEHARNRLKLSPEKVEAIRKQYSNQAARVAVELSDSANKRLNLAVAHIIDSGAHTGQATNMLRKQMEKAGASYKNPYLFEAVARVQLSEAYNAGRWNMLKDPEIDEELWGFTYSTVGDDRVRQTHKELDGTSLPKDDPFWLTYWPPNGYGCRCTVLEEYDEQVVKEPGTINGETVQPDKGFNYNAGEVMRTNMEPDPPPHPEVIEPPMKPKPAPKPRPVKKVVALPAVMPDGIQVRDIVKAKKWVSFIVKAKKDSVKVTFRAKMKKLGWSQEVYTSVPTFMFDAVRSKWVEKGIVDLTPEIKARPKTVKIIKKKVEPVEKIPVRPPMPSGIENVDLDKAKAIGVQMKAAKSHKEYFDLAEGLRELGWKGPGFTAIPVWRWEPDKSGWRKLYTSWISSHYKEPLKPVEIKEDKGNWQISDEKANASWKDRYRGPDGQLQLQLNTMQHQANVYSAFKEATGKSIGDLKSMSAAESHQYDDALYDVLKRFTPENKRKQSMDNMLKGSRTVWWDGDNTSRKKIIKKLNKQLTQFKDMVGPLASPDVMELFAEKYTTYDIFTTKNIRASMSHDRKMTLGSNFDVKTTFHELGHLLEHSTGYGRVSREFQNKRAGGKIQKRAIDGQDAYVDKFIDKYVGKSYRSGHTEVTSMGIQNFTDKKKMMAFFRKDPEHFTLTHGVISGAF